MSSATVEFGTGDYAGTAYGGALGSTGWNMYSMSIFARICVPSGTPTKTVADYIGMYGTGGDAFDHDYAIPPDGAQPGTGPAVSWQWVGLVSGKPRIWMRDGRPVLNQFSQPRNMMPTGLNGAPNFQFILDGPSALSTGVCHDVCYNWRWTSTALNGEPSDCTIWVDGVSVATFNFPAFASGQPGWLAAVDTSQVSLTVGGTRDTGGVISESGTIRLGEVFFVKHSGTPSAITTAQAESYYNACPGPGIPAPLIGYPLVGASDLADSVGSRDLTETGGSLTTGAGCACGGDIIGTTPEIPQANSSECCASPGTEGSGVAAPGAGVERPVLLSAAWNGRCEGGGSVALLADLTDAEDWSDS